MSCNRTYYGEIGSTYHLSLSSETIAAALGLNHPQQVDSSHGQGSGSGAHGGPAQFVCHLTFFAAGDNFGDLVQKDSMYSSYSLVFLFLAKMALSTYIIRLLLFCFSIMAYPLLAASEQQFTTTYTKEQLKILAEKLQKEFAELPHQSFDQQCANSDEKLPDSSSNPFYQYVVNVHKEVETANDPHAFYIRNGYTFWSRGGPPVELFVNPTYNATNLLILQLIQSFINVLVEPPKLTVHLGDQTLINSTHP
ncbi:hypothetical protein Ocin01_02153 [Orchesella cincta]|uniref:Uncharacterized protein n=1 Tax=Orchesella cincta TaxID=48709 RepID=A0A1D2NGY6_ORCCI|nr:hypothetical protein Ocin01_02153 [Orchesella cincta]